MSLVLMCFGEWVQYMDTQNAAIIVQIFMKGWVVSSLNQKNYFKNNKLLRTVVRELEYNHGIHIYIYRRAHVNLFNNWRRLQATLCTNACTKWLQCQHGIEMSTPIQLKTKSCLDCLHTCNISAYYVLLGMCILDPS